MNRLRLEFAAERFLDAMRLEFLKENPNKDSPIGELQDYSPLHRSILMRAVGAAILASQTKKDAAFAAWSERRAENVQ